MSEPVAPADSPQPDTLPAETAAVESTVPPATAPGWLRLATPALALVAAVAALAAFAAWQLTPPPGSALPAANQIDLGVPLEVPSPFKGFAIRPERPAPEVALTGADGPWSLAAARGRPVALFFGYTHCPDVCPQTLQRLAAAKRLLPAGDDALAVALITVDPERDTPEVLADYVQGFDPSFTGLTGSPEDIQAVAAAYGVRFMPELPPALATEAARIAGHDAGSAATAEHDSGGHDSGTAHDAGPAHGADVPSVLTPNTDAYTVAHSGVVFLIDGQGQLRSSFIGPFDPADLASDVRVMQGLD